MEYNRSTTTNNLRDSLTTRPQNIILPPTRQRIVQPLDIRSLNRITRPLQPLQLTVHLVPQNLPIPLI
ncbi:hypothetical protein [Streptomyces parvulus]|uniref:hypothetical protein n=1 Tax=Streptomyces parvulus TaxID=146923 RepID=UPI0011C06ADA|nr:hypothetical protein [Streptomyces parvulus]